MTEDQKLTALLRLKRYEQPPAGYYEKLLQDVHRRQRAELLRRPLWAIALDRFQTFFSAHSMGNVSFAGSMAIVALVGILGISRIGGTAPSAAPQVAVAQTVVQPAAVDLRSDAPSAPRLITLQDSPVAVSDLRDDETVSDARLIPASASKRVADTHQPRYVIDTRPVSYEATKVSFSF